MITHEESRPVPELIACPANARARADALRLAWKIHHELVEQPDSFAATARQYSDESVTAAAGGSLGVFNAAAVPPVFVDAFANLNEGQVSRPVETAQGYHILRRLKVPPVSRFGFARIVIKFEDANGWRRTDREVVSHTRAEARTIAQAIMQKLQDAPESFGALAQAYSESDDAPGQGEMGVWSTYDGNDSDFMVLTRAAELPIGGISQPFELGSGIYIVQRRPDDRQPRFAASVITLAHDGSQIARYMGAPSGHSAVEAKSTAERLANELSEFPDRFDAHMRDDCNGVTCGLTAWSRGQGLADLERALLSLDLGGITRTPIASPIGFLVARREDAAKHPPPPAPKPSFTFPYSRLFEGTASATTDR
ncbi:MAG TPA: peptidylprolyl isomerase [Polyangiales bacterium]|nr:peptidylprolyl isomerase [Polyangiales bacterium]